MIFLIDQHNIGAQRPDIQTHEYIQLFYIIRDGMHFFDIPGGRFLKWWMVIAPDMNYIERAFNAVKYGEISKAPVMDISIPTVHDPAAAPTGKHVLSATVQFAPFEPAGGWEAHRADFTERLLDLLAVYAPGIREQIVASELLTPADLQRDYGMTGGH